MEKKPGKNLIPANDNGRVQALNRYQILGSPPERSFDNIAKLATQFFNLPVALINFVDRESVFVKSHVGLDGITTSPRNASLCSLAMLTDEVTVFETIPLADPCLLANSVSAAELGFKFYAGAPLITFDGFRIGTICVMGYEKRKFSGKERTLLQNMATIVITEIELRLQEISMPANVKKPLNQEG